MKGILDQAKEDETRWSLKTGEESWLFGYAGRVEAVTGAAVDWFVVTEHAYEDFGILVVFYPEAARHWGWPEFEGEIGADHLFFDTANEATVAAIHGSRRILEAMHRYKEDEAGFQKWISEGSFIGPEWKRAVHVDLDA